MRNTKMKTQNYQLLLEVENAAPIKMWTEGVPVEDDAKEQLMNTAKMPFIFKTFGGDARRSFGKRFHYW